MKSNNKVFTLSNVVISDSDDNEICTLSPEELEEFGNSVTITKVHSLKIRSVMIDSEISEDWQKGINHLAANCRKNFSPELVERNEILMIESKEHDKRRLRDKEYVEQTIQDTIDVFANGNLLRMDLLANLDVEFELVAQDPTGSQVLDYVISKDKVLKKKVTVIPSVTLDTSVIVEYLEKRRKAMIVESLLELAQNEQLDLRVTGRIREDIPRQPLSDRINELPELGIREIGSIIRTGHWRPGRDMAGSTKFQEVVDSIPETSSQPKRKRPDWRDWDHVQTHYLKGRDVFLTWDKGILNAAPHLKEKLGIVIMTPENYLGPYKKQIEPRSAGSA